MEKTSPVQRIVRYTAAFCLAAGALLGGCATAPKDAPAFSAEALPQDPGYALVVVYRQMVPPLAYKSTVSVNGVEAVEIPNQAFTWIRVKPGHVMLKNDWSFAAGNPAGAVDLEVEAGHVYYVEVVYYIGGANVIGLAGTMSTFHNPEEGRGFEPREEAEALKSLKVCCRYVPVEDDYAPPEPAPSDIPATDTGP